MRVRLLFGAVACAALIAGPLACDSSSDDGAVSKDTTPGADGAVGDTGGADAAAGDTGGADAAAGDTGGADTGGTDAGGLTDADTGGTVGEKKTALLSIATIISPTQPIQFIAETTYVAAPDPTNGGAIHFVLQPLQTAPGKATREPVGDPIEADGVVDGEGYVVLDVGTQQVVGDANPISGSDIEATLKLIGQIKSADLACGIIEGSVTQPFEAPLAGSTWAAITITDTTAANLPAPVGKCPGEGPDVDAGGTEDAGGMDAGGTDTGGTEDAGTTLTFGPVWDILEAYSCTNGYCHGGGAGDLTMATAEGAYAALVGVNSSCDGSQRVTPGNPADSLLYSKIAPGMAADCGDKMPKGADEMDAADAETIRAWIEGGAAQ